MKVKKNRKNIYKKSLAMDLIKLGHNLHHTMRNRYDMRYQVFVFIETPEFIRDLLYINARNEELKNGSYSKSIKLNMLA